MVAEQVVWVVPEVWNKAQAAPSLGQLVEFHSEGEVAVVGEVELEVGQRMKTWT